MICKNLTFYFYFFLSDNFYPLARMVMANGSFQSPCHLVHTRTVKKFLLETKTRRLDKSEFCQFYYDTSSSSHGTNEEISDAWVKVNVADWFL